MMSTGLIFIAASVAYLIIYGALAVWAEHRARKDGTSLEVAESCGKAMAIWPVALPAMLGIWIGIKIRDRATKEEK